MYITPITPKIQSKNIHNNKNLKKFPKYEQNFKGNLNLGNNENNISSDFFRATNENNKEGDNKEELTYTFPKYIYKKCGIAIPVPTLKKRLEVPEQLKGLSRSQLRDKLLEVRPYLSDSQLNVLCDELERMQQGLPRWDGIISMSRINKYESIGEIAEKTDNKKLKNDYVEKYCHYIFNYVEKAGDKHLPVVERTFDDNAISAMEYQIDEGGCRYGDNTLMDIINSSDPIESDFVVYRAICIRRDADFDFQKKCNLFIENLKEGDIIYPQNPNHWISTAPVYSNTADMFSPDNGFAATGKGYIIRIHVHSGAKGLDYRGIKNLREKGKWIEFLLKASNMRCISIDHIAQIIDADYILPESEENKNISKIENAPYDEFFTTKTIKRKSGSKARYENLKVFISPKTGRTLIQEFEPIDDNSKELVVTKEMEILPGINGAPATIIISNFDKDGNLTGERKDFYHPNNPLDKMNDILSDISLKKVINKQKFEKVYNKVESIVSGIENIFQRFSNLFKSPVGKLQGITFTDISQLDEMIKKGILDSFGDNLTNKDIKNLKAIKKLYKFPDKSFTDSLYPDDLEDMRDMCIKMIEYTKKHGITINNDNKKSIFMYANSYNYPPINTFVEKLKGKWQCDETKADNYEYKIRNVLYFFLLDKKYNELNSKLVNLDISKLSSNTVQFMTQMLIESPEKITYFLDNINTIDNLLKSNNTTVNAPFENLFNNNEFSKINKVFEISSQFEHFLNIDIKNIIGNITNDKTETKIYYDIIMDSIKNSPNVKDIQKSEITNTLTGDYSEKIIFNDGSDAIIFYSFDFYKNNHNLTKLEYIYNNIKITLSIKDSNFSAGILLLENYATNSSKEIQLHSDISSPKDFDMLKTCLLVDCSNNIITKIDGRYFYKINDEVIEISNSDIAKFPSGKDDRAKYLCKKLMDPKGLFNEEELNGQLGKIRILARMSPDYLLYRLAKITSYSNKKIINISYDVGYCKFYVIYENGDYSIFDNLGKFISGASDGILISKDGFRVDINGAKPINLSLAKERTKTIKEEDGSTSSYFVMRRGYGERNKMQTFMTGEAPEGTHIDINKFSPQAVFIKNVSEDGQTITKIKGFHKSVYTDKNGKKHLYNYKIGDEFDSYIKTIKTNLPDGNNVSVEIKTDDGNITNVQYTSRVKKDKIVVQRNNDNPITVAIKDILIGTNNLSDEEIKEFFISNLSAEYMYDVIKYGYRFDLYYEILGGCNPDDRIIRCGYNDNETIGHEISHLIYNNIENSNLNYFKIYKDELNKTDSAAFTSDLFEKDLLKKHPKNGKTLINSIFNHTIQYYTPLSSSTRGGYEIGADETFAEAMGSFNYYKMPEEELLYMYLPNTINSLLYEYAKFIIK